jgi:hypothetical protein
MHFFPLLSVGLMENVNELSLLKKKLSLQWFLLLLPSNSVHVPATNSSYFVTQLSVVGCPFVLTNVTKVELLKAIVKVGRSAGNAQKALSDVLGRTNLGSLPAIYTSAVMLASGTLISEFTPRAGTHLVICVAAKDQEYTKY